MKVGDLIVVAMDLERRPGVLVKVVSDDPIVGEKFWLVHWTDGTRDTTRERFLEVINESR